MNDSNKTPPKADKPPKSRAAWAGAGTVVWPLEVTLPRYLSLTLIAIPYLVRSSLPCKIVRNWTDCKDYALSSLSPNRISTAVSVRSPSRCTTLATAALACADE